MKIPARLDGRYLIDIRIGFNFIITKAQFLSYNIVLYRSHSNIFFIIMCNPILTIILLFGQLGLQDYRMRSNFKFCW